MFKVSFSSGRLYEDGKLDLDKPVADYVTSWPQKHPAITTKHLASHTAGVRHYKEEKGNKKDFHDFAQNMAFHDPGYNRQYYRLCVVRDPVERFVSCYNHLALVNKEIEHSPEEVLSLVRESKSPNNHFLPQEVFLGRNNRYYDRIYNVDQIFQLEDDLNKFFNKDIKAHHFQTSGSSVEFPVDLTDALVEEIKETYKEDYKAFGKYF